MSAGYEVGYRKPPKKTRFQKGKSGNPKGRPKGPLDFQKLAVAELKSTITITEGGKKKTVSKMEALIKTLYARATQGDKAALKMLIEIIKSLPENAFWKEDTVYVEEVTQRQLDALNQFVIETGEYLADQAKDDPASNKDDPASKKDDPASKKDDPASKKDDPASKK